MVGVPHTSRNDGPVPLQRCISARGSSGAVPRGRGGGPKRTISSQEDPWHKDTLFNGVVGARNQETLFSSPYWRPATKKRLFLSAMGFRLSNTFFRPIRTNKFQTHQKQNGLTLLPPCAPVWMLIG